MPIWKKLQEILSKTKEKSPGADVRIRREKKSSAKDRSIMTDKCNWWIQFCAEGYAAGEGCYEDTKTGNSGGIVEKEAAKRTRLELFMDFSRKELRDCCRYLQIEYEDDWDKEKLARVLEEQLREHPEYYLIVLERDGFKSLLEFARKPDGKLKIYEDDEENIRLWFAMGLIDIQIDTQEPVARLSLAADAQEILDRLNASDWRKECRGISDSLEKAYGCVQAYGVLELDSFYEIFRKCFRPEMEKADFMRLIYWHCNYDRLFQTLTDMTGKAYAAAFFVELESCFSSMARYAADIPYRDFDSSVLADRDRGFDKIYPHWGDLTVCVSEISGMDGRNAAHRLEEGFRLVVNGCTCTDLIQFVMEIAEPVSIVEWTNLWSICMGVVLDSGLPMLKGHSRNSFSNATGCSLETIPVIDSERTADQITADTHLYELPCSLQYSLLEAGSSPDLNEGIQKFREKMEREAGSDNRELQFMLGSLYLMTGQKQEAEMVYKHLQEQLPYTDPGLEEALRTLNGSGKKTGNRRGSTKKRYRKRK